VVPEFYHLIKDSRIVHFLHGVIDIRDHLRWHLFAKLCIGRVELFSQGLPTGRILGRYNGGNQGESED
jgi:hypothetical protein